MMPLVLGFWLGDHTWERLAVLLVIVNSSLRHTGMPSFSQQEQAVSSERQAQVCSYDEAGEETHLGKEKQETEAPNSNRQPAGSRRQEEPGADQPESPDHDDKQEVTSEEGSAQAQREEGIGFSHFSDKQKTQRGGKVSAGRVTKRRLHKSRRQDEARSSLVSSYQHMDGKRRAEKSSKSGPFFFFQGKNGEKIVSHYCESRGWKRIYNKNREDFKLMWCQTKVPSSCSNFREGKQLVYQIPNNGVLTTKIGLISSLREYERVISKFKHGQGLGRLKLEEFIPTTFCMDVMDERDVFFGLSAQQEEENKSHVWICKPTGRNQGQGIFLLKSREDMAAFRLKYDLNTRRTYRRWPKPYVVQHYIQNPLLLKERKFDVRSYLLVACTDPYMVFFGHGYVRLSCDVYDLRSNDLSIHLTNQYVQKQNPFYSLLKEDTVWSMESFNTYVNDRFQVAKALPRDRVLGTFARRMQQIMTQCFLAAKHKLHRRLGFFDLIGCDFLIDEDFKVWLLEMNCNPALHTHCKVLKEVISRTVEETLDLTLEIFNKLLPLASQRDFVLLYNGSAPGSGQADSKRNVSDECHQKTTNTSQKPEGLTQKRSLGVASPDRSTGLKNITGRRSTASTLRTPLGLKVASVGESSLSSNYKSKDTKPPVQLEPKHHLKAVDHVKHVEKKTRTTVSLSSPAMSD